MWPLRATSTRSAAFGAWIHGHTHESCDYVENGTRVVCNPRGYLPMEANPGFQPDFIVEVSETRCVLRRIANASASPREECGAPTRQRLLVLPDMRGERLTDQGLVALAGPLRERLEALDDRVVEKDGDAGFAAHGKRRAAPALAESHMPFFLSSPLSGSGLSDGDDSNHCQMLRPVSVTQAYAPDH
jgi:hypothetical protein